MADFESLGDFDSIDPKQFAQIVKSTPDAKITEVMRSDARGKILDAIFDRLPSLFRADRAGSTDAVIHWTITGRGDGGADTYEVVISDGTCTASNDPQHEPKLAITVGPIDFLKVISGSGNPTMLFMTGKLKAKGDIGLAAQIPNLFDIPKA
jgi:putative sterol carrier protein